MQKIALIKKIIKSYKDLDKIPHYELEENSSRRMKILQEYSILSYIDNYFDNNKRSKDGSFTVRTQYNIYEKREYFENLYGKYKLEQKLNKQLNKDKNYANNTNKI